MKNNTIALLIFSLLMLPGARQAYARQFTVGKNVRVFIEQNAELQVGPDLVNQGFLDNSGSLSLYRGYNDQGIINLIEGILIFRGDQDQQFTIPVLDVRGLVLDKDGQLLLETDSVTVREKIEFIRGILSMPENGKVIVQSTANALGGNENSYLDGSLTAEGTGYRHFPIGEGNSYTPLTLVDVQGVNSRIRVSATSRINRELIPERDVIGVSDHALWRITTEQGQVDSVLVGMDFNNAELTDFRVSNEINAQRISPVIVALDTVSDQYFSLGVSELTNTDSLSFGSLTAERYLAIGSGNTRTVALGLAPQLFDEGFIYIPNAFSPSADTEEDKTFRIFGNRILQEDFELKIFNRNNVLVYSTEDFTEANETGWNGINQNTGNEEPSGLYYFTISYKLQGDDRPTVEQNALYLIR